MNSLNNHLISFDYLIFKLFIVLLFYCLYVCNHCRADGIDLRDTEKARRHIVETTQRNYFVNPLFIYAYMLIYYVGSKAHNMFFGSNTQNMFAASNAKLCAAIRCAADNSEHVLGL